MLCHGVSGFTKAWIQQDSEGVREWVRIPSTCREDPNFSHRYLSRPRRCQRSARQDVNHTLCLGIQRTWPPVTSRMPHKMLHLKNDWTKSSISSIITPISYIQHRISNTCPFPGAAEALLPHQALRHGGEGHALLRGGVVGLVACWAAVNGAKSRGWWVFFYCWPF